MTTHAKNGGHIRVLIADDQALFARMLEALLADDADVEVIGHAANGAEAVELADAEDPDVILMDISMPMMDGLEATRTLRAQRAGADAYVPKMHIAAGLREAIHSL